MKFILIIDQHLTTSLQCGYAYRAGAQSPVGISPPSTRGASAPSEVALFLCLQFVMAGGSRHLRVAVCLLYGRTNLVPSAAFGLVPFGGSKLLLQKETTLSKLQDLEDNIHRYLQQTNALIAALIVEECAQYLDSDSLFNVLWLLQDRIEDINKTYREYVQAVTEEGNNE